MSVADAENPEPAEGFAAHHHDVGVAQIRFLQSSVRNQQTALLVAGREQHAATVGTFPGSRIRGRAQVYSAREGFLSLGEERKCLREYAGVVVDQQEV